MIKFVNAKLNLGLDIVRKREDGYHDLETVFYPVGIHNGTTENPEPFCDILEITPAGDTQFVMSGRQVDCPLEKNLVFKAWKAFKEEYEKRCGIPLPQYRIELEKHLPDGAGLGGGSADAAFTLTTLNEMTGKPFSEDVLECIALTLGADCPFFIRNLPCFAQGVGEMMTPIDLDLCGMWCVLIKPELSIPTKEAFAGVSPQIPFIPLTEIIKNPIADWQGRMKNDFEKSIFPHHPVLAKIKDEMIRCEAEYASMSGSGSTIFGIFSTEGKAREALSHFTGDTGLYAAICLL